MKIKNEALRSLKPEDIKTFDDIALLVESASETYFRIAEHHFQLQRRREDGIWKEVFVEIDTIAKAVDCNEKTVDRFNRDMGCIIYKRNRFRNGKQTSNVYTANKVFYQYFKAFWRLGLFKGDLPFKVMWSWIKKLWVNSGCNHEEFMNKVWNRKPGQSNNLNDICKEGSQKMSLGDSGKCPSISNPLTEVMNICTSFVPSSDVRKAEVWLLKKVREAVNDIKWYAVDKKNPIGRFQALFSSRFRAKLA